MRRLSTGPVSRYSTGAVSRHRARPLETPGRVRGRGGCRAACRARSACAHRRGRPSHDSRRRRGGRRRCLCSGASFGTSAQRRRAPSESRQPGPLRRMSTAGGRRGDSDARGGGRLEGGNGGACGGGGGRCISGKALKYWGRSGHGGAWRCRAGKRRGRAAAGPVAEAVYAGPVWRRVSRAGTSEPPREWCGRRLPFDQFGQPAQTSPTGQTVVCCRDRTTGSRSPRKSPASASLYTVEDASETGRPRRAVTQSRPGSLRQPAAHSA